MDSLIAILSKELYKKSLYEFVKDFWSECEPSKFIDGKLIQYYCEVFQYACREWIGYDKINILNIPKQSKDINIIDIRSNTHNICINVPPRHTKSLIFNVLGPVWIWSLIPLKVASISHTAQLATRMNEGRWRIINGEKFKEIFPEIEISTNTKSLIKDKRGGELYSLNRNSMTGYGGDIIINDDLTNAETARKDKEEMNNAWSYYQNTLPSRINNIKKCMILNIQQRLAPNDITGHILSDPKLSESYSFITLPAIFSKTTYLVYPISGKVEKFNKGDFLWPERFNNYEQLKRQVGDTVFETQYLQNPVASDKTVIKEDMIREENITDIPSINDADMIYASHDFPIKDKETSDFLGSVLAYRVGSILYIKECLERKMAYSKSVDYVRNIDNLYPGIIQVIEDKANGSPILQQLQDEVTGMQPYQPGSNSKQQRLESASLYMISNNVVFIRSELKDNKYILNKGLINLKNRLLNFPFVEHDDIIDAFSQLVLFVFMDKRWSVYARSFNDLNIIDTNDIKVDLQNIFLNKEGDLFKIALIGVKYDITSKLIVLKEERVKMSIEDVLKHIRDKYKVNVVIDCSEGDALYGVSNNDIYVEKYIKPEFEKSVSDLSLAFSKKNILISRECKLVRAEIDNFKFNKSKNDNMKFVTEKDGFIALLRVAMKYYSITV